MTHDPKDRAWSLMTKTRKGLVSILRDLALDECRQAYMRLDPEFGRTYTSYESEDGGQISFGGHTVSGDEIEIREVLGPTDWDRKEIETWRGEWPKYQFIKRDDPWHFENRGGAVLRKS